MRSLFLNIFKLPLLSATCRGLLFRVLATPSANTHYLPQCRRRERCSSMSAPMPASLYLQMVVCWRGVGASVPHMNCMAWIQQSSCSKVLLPQRCFSAIKEYSSPSCPLSCTAVLEQFGSLFPLPLSSLFYSSQSVI